MINFIRIANQKSKKYYIVYLAFLLTFIILISSYCYINNVYKYTVKNRLQNRVLNVVNNNEENKIKKTISKIQHIDSVYPFYVNISMFSPNNEKYIFNYYDYEVKLINGDVISNLKENEIIIPNTLNYKPKDELIVYFNKKQYKFKVVGIYNSKTIGTNDIFTSETFMKKHSTDFNEKYWNVIIDDYDNLDKVIKKLQSKNFDVSLKDDSGIKDINIYKLSLKIFLFGEVILFMFIIYIMGIIIKDIINNNNSDIAILKTCGFHNSTILKIIINSLLKISIKIIIIITLIIITTYSVLVITNKITYIFLNYYYMVAIITFSSLLFLIIILIVSLSYYKKIKNISPIVLFNTD